MVFIDLPKVFIDFSIVFIEFAMSSIDFSMVSIDFSMHKHAPGERVECRLGHNPCWVSIVALDAIIVLVGLVSFRLGLGLV